MSVWGQGRDQVRKLVEINSRWTQLIITTNPGSRSEGVTSKLLFDDETITPWFDVIVIGSTRFEFVIGANLWDFKGYDRMVGDVRFESALDRIHSEDMERGWYPGSLIDRKAGTPDSWIWVSRGDTEMFLDPERIEEAVQVHHLSIRSYDGGLMMELRPE
jgi:hypothetical protein